MSAQAYTIDWRVFGFAATLAGLTGLAFGIFPALLAMRGAVAQVQRTSTPNVSYSRMQRALVGAQIAVTVVLLTGSVALGGAFLRLLREDFGYDTSSIVTMQVSLAGTGRDNAGSAAAYYGEVLQRVQALPGVVSASATTALPLAIDSFMGGRFDVDNSGPTSLVTVMPVAPGFFHTMGTRILAGREFSPEDLPHGEPLAIVNEEFAKPYGGPAAVVGRHATAPRWGSFRIIGVAATMRVRGPTDRPQPQLFTLARGVPSMALVVRVTGAPGDRMEMIRDVVRAVDSNVAVFDARTMESRLGHALARPRFHATVVIFFGGIALLLAVIGVYGVVSYSVVQRTREMGIRLALGTSPARLRASLLRQSILPVAVGSIAGVALALLFSRYLQTLVAGADAAPLATTLIGVALTGSVAALAIWSATRHVTRLDIADVLRAETE